MRKELRFGPRSLLNSQSCFFSRCFERSLLQSIKRFFPFLAENPRFLILRMHPNRKSKQRRKGIGVEQHEKSPWRRRGPRRKSDERKAARLSLRGGSRWRNPRVRAHAQHRQGSASGRTSQGAHAAADCLDTGVTGLGPSRSRTAVTSDEWFALCALVYASVKWVQEWGVEDWGRGVSVLIPGKHFGPDSGWLPTHVDCKSCSCILLISPLAFTAEPSKHTPNRHPWRQLWKRILRITWIQLSLFSMEGATPCSQTRISETLTGDRINSTNLHTCFERLGHKVIFLIYSNFLLVTLRCLLLS